MPDAPAPITAIVPGSSSSAQPGLGAEHAAAELEPEQRLRASMPVASTTVFASITVPSN